LNAGKPQKCMISHGGHLGYLTWSTNTILEGVHTRTNWTKFGFISSSASEEDFPRFPIFQWIIIHGSHLGCMARSLDTILEKDKRRSITSKIGIIMTSGS